MKFKVEYKGIIKEVECKSRKTMEDSLRKGAKIVK